MAQVDVNDLARRLGLPIDGNDPTGSLENIIAALQEKAAKGQQALDGVGNLTERMGQLEGLLGSIKANPNLTDEARAKAEEERTANVRDEEPVRRAANELARVKNLPSNVWELNALLERAPLDDEERSFQRFCDTAFLLGKLDRNGRGVAGTDLWRRAGQVCPAFARFTSAGNSNWVPTMFSGDLWRDVRLNANLAALMNEIDMPSPTFENPYSTGSATAYLTAEATDLTGVTEPTTGKSTLTAKGIGVALKFSGEFSEDSVVAVMPLCRQDIVEVLADGLDYAILNGDDTATHMDTDIENAGATHVAAGWKGLRKLCLAGSLKTDANSFTTTICRTGRTAMGKYGINPRNLIWVPGPKSYMKMLGLSEVLTMDKYGQFATLVTGELARFDGIPVVPSGAVREDVDATGVNGGSGNTKTLLYLVNRAQFLVGWRRRVTIEDDRFILADYTLVVGKMRVAFAPRIACSASYPVAHLFYNMA